jgi:hypothetical protein
MPTRVLSFALRANVIGWNFVVTLRDDDRRRQFCRTARCLGQIGQLLLRQAAPQVHTPDHDIPAREPVLHDLTELLQHVAGKPLR